MTDLLNFKCKFIPKIKIWDIADDFRDVNWYPNKLPVDIEYIIESKLNLFIIPQKNINELVKIDAYLRSDFIGIVVDERQYMDDKDRYKKPASILICS